MLSPVSCDIEKNTTSIIINNNNHNPNTNNNKQKQVILSEIKENQQKQQSSRSDYYYKTGDNDDQSSHQYYIIASPIFTNYQLFKLVMDNKYLKRIIYSFIRSHNQSIKKDHLLKGIKFNVFKFHQINSSEWLCQNKLFHCLIYKLKLQQIQKQPQQREQINNRKYYDYYDEDIGEEVVFTFKSLYIFSRECRDYQLFLYIYNEYREMFQSSYKVFDENCYNGNLKILKFLHEQGGIESSVEAMNNAAVSGRLDIIKYLVGVGRFESTVRSVDEASRNGHFEVVKYLLENNIQTCTDRAIFNASVKGHFEIVKFLLEKKPWESDCIFDVNNNFRSSFSITSVSGFTTEKIHKIPLNILKYFYSKSFDLKHLLYDSLYPLCRQNSHSVDLELVRFYCEIVFQESNVQYHMYQQFIKQLMRCLVACSDFGHNEIVDYLLGRYGHTISPTNIISQCINGAASTGNLELLKRFHKEFPPVKCSKQAMDQYYINPSNSICNFNVHRSTPEFHIKQLEVVKFLHFNRSEGCTADCMNMAAKYGNFELVKFLQFNRNEGCTYVALNEAALSGHFEILLFLLEHNPQLSVSRNIIELLVGKGNRLEIIKFLTQHFPLKVSCRAVEISILHSMEQFLYLLEKSNYEFTSSAFETAAKCQDLEKFKILYTQNKNHVELTYKVKTNAARNGDFEFIKYLYEHTNIQSKEPPDGSYMLTLDAAAHSGSLRVLKFIHYRCTLNQLECSRSAIDLASVKGHLNIIKFLCENRSEGFTNLALNNAIKNGQSEVFQYLYPLHKDGSMEDLFFANIASENGEIQVLKYLSSLEDPNKESLLFSPGTMDIAIKNDQISILYYLYQNRKEGVSTLGFFHSCHSNNLQCMLFLLQYYPEFCVFDNVETDHRKFISNLSNEFQQRKL